MNKDKQIKEMAKIMCVSDSDCITCTAQSPCHLKNFAKRLYEKGYRKASEVAEEIFEEIEAIPKDQPSYVLYVFLTKKIAELKNKYEVKIDE